MEIIIHPRADDACHGAARRIAALVRRKPEAVLGFATGRTQRPVYAELVRQAKAGTLDLSRVTTFNLDELVGVAPDHPASYRRYMGEQLLDQLANPPERVHIPDGGAADLRAACADYERAIRDAGGIDLQLLGIGPQGHIAFNEPTSSLASRTRIKTLTAKTRATLDGFDDGSAPLHVVTMGIGTILEAKHCLMVATGRAKARPVKQMIEGPLCAFVPASALQMHPRTTVLLDDDAASELELADYFRAVAKHKPAWQLEDELR
jgi:glucosamine-6-phosphate deaminase